MPHGSIEFHTIAEDLDCFVSLGKVSFDNINELENTWYEKITEIEGSPCIASITHPKDYCLDNKQVSISLVESYLKESINTLLPKAIALTLKQRKVDNKNCTIIVASLFERGLLPHRITQDDIQVVCRECSIDFDYDCLYIQELAMIEADKRWIELPVEDQLNLIRKLVFDLKDVEDSISALQADAHAANRERNSMAAFIHKIIGSGDALALAIKKIGYPNSEQILNEWDNQKWNIPYNCYMEHLQCSAHLATSEMARSKDTNNLPEGWEVVVATYKKYLFESCAVGVDFTRIGY